MRVDDFKWNRFSQWTSILSSSAFINWTACRGMCYTFSCNWQLRNIIGIHLFIYFNFLFQVKPLKYPDRICTPSPEPVRRSRKTTTSTCRQAPASLPRRHREPSLSTITEEPGSWHSTTHEIVVEPELVVETTTFTRPHPPHVCIDIYPLADRCQQNTIIIVVSGLNFARL